MTVNHDNARAAIADAVAAAGLARVAVDAAQLEQETTAEQLELTIRRAAALQVDLDQAAATIADLQGQVTTLTAELDQARARIRELEALLDPRPDARELVGMVTPFQIGDYDDLDVVLPLILDSGVKMIRGRFQNAGGRGARVMDFCAEHDIRWLMTFVEEEWATKKYTTAKFDAALVTFENRIRAAAAHPAFLRVALGWENINEPDHDRGSWGVAGDWPQRCTKVGALMRRLRDELAPDLPILSPAMHDIANDNANGAHWQMLADAGCYFDVVSLHAYPKGKELTNELDKRLGYVFAAFGTDVRVWITESGYVTEAVAGFGGVVITEAQAAGYVSEWAAIVAAHPVVEKVFYYELLGVGRGLFRNGAWTAPGAVLRDDWTLAT